MRPFEYVSPNNRAQAISLLGASWGKAEILAGGTDLLALMKDDVVTPKRLINIKGIHDLHGVSSNVHGLRIGALTTLGDLADDAAVRRNYPALAEALLEAASPQIRNQATLGGNLCQRPRCWYFRNGFGLLPKNQAGKELVAEGENRY
ncbi:MAG TPA: FAD binding domain-containing protein, partial [Terriglobales bacterium]|nr:FAD binding domain-containing protein [Terriglobales bacterium]